MKDIVASLQSRREEVEGLVTGACRSLGDSTGWDSFDLAESFDDLWRLSGREDCCYDRPSIGFNYAMWYHARRMQDALRLVLPTLYEHGTAGTILDLGCGTGATTWALALAVTSGLELEPTRVVAVDGSPPMLRAAEQMWTWLETESPIAGQFGQLTVDWRCRSWTQPDVALDGPDVVASFLFDDSDSTRTEEVANAMHRLALHHRARYLHLTSAHAKRRVLAQAGTAICTSENWMQDDGQRVPKLWGGPMQRLGAYRRAVLEPSGVNPNRLRRDPGLDHSDSPISMRLRRVPSPDHLDLSTAPLVLDSRQEEAAAPADRLTVIVGAAGSGKSRVLVERIALQLEARMNAEARVLVTAFNKLLVFQLAAWFEERVEESALRFVRSGMDADIRFEDPDVPAARFVRFLNWDKVPTKLFGADTIRNATAFERLLAERAREVVDGRDLKKSEIRAVVEPRFLLAEMHRVIWGLGVETSEQYRDVNRVGRQAQLGERQRRVVWEILMGDGHPETFDHVRIRASNGEPSETHTHLFIDECQDFTPADFRMAAGLVESARGICAAGDETQAMHLGTSYRRPGRLKGVGESTWRVWQQHELSGTYRLPLRVCEAVAPLATDVGSGHRVPQSDAEGEIDLVDLEAVSSATLGVRPVVVVGDDDEMAAQLAGIVDQYRPIIEGTIERNRVVTFAEGGVGLRKAFDRHAVGGLRTEVRSMSKIKGLERPIVVWPTSADPPAHEAYREWIFTILTRTTGLLVIAVNGLAQEALDVLRILRRDRLLPWNSAAAEYLESL